MIYYKAEYNRINNHKHWQFEPKLIIIDLPIDLIELKQESMKIISHPINKNDT